MKTKHINNLEHVEDQAECLIKFERRAFKMMVEAGHKHGVSSAKYEHFQRLWLKLLDESIKALKEFWLIHFKYESRLERERFKQQKEAEQLAGDSANRVKKKFK